MAIKVRNPFSLPARRAYRAMRVIAALRRNGCRVLRSAAHVSPPIIRVDRRPSWIDTYGYIAPPGGCVRVPVLCAALKWGTRIEWISTEDMQ